MKAVMLAAGKGERLWPLTEHRPKPMLPVANRPLLEHILETLEAACIDEVILVVGSNRERVQDHFGDGHDRDLDITYVTQSRQLGTGHALLQAETHIGESFITLNGDRIITTDLINAVRNQHTTADLVMGVTRVETPSRYGVVDLDGQTVTDITEQPHPDQVRSTYINAGVYAFTPEIFGAIRDTESHGEQALTDALTPFIKDRRLQAVQYRGRWLDVSVPWDLLAVNNALNSAQESSSTPTTTTVDESAVVADTAILGAGTTVHPQAAVLQRTTVGDNVRVGPGAIVENAILLSDVSIEAGAVVTDCIIGANTTIGPNTTIESGTRDVVLNGSVYDDVSFGGLIGDNVSIGGNVTLAPGTLIGNEVTIEGGTRVSGRIADDTHVT
ncbi:sugar phosphate nucleotidyltransferase [Halorubrum halodurans]|uniref:Bifunctional protein GlmU n=1 Tax=Halorubrum halodurans TaxID=1383851 RepID=A0A256IJ57_9EURY|nr:sugar phosphate nucleotidyltransferase [Halorubrum halodurans]OYR56608.1 glucose-1-phosphate thymidylyltransferase [Halorubrum halodurans]